LGLRILPIQRTRAPFPFSGLVLRNIYIYHPSKAYDFVSLQPIEMFQPHYHICLVLPETLKIDETKTSNNNPIMALIAKQHKY
jgi:hypothetical protein